MVGSDPSSHDPRIVRSPVGPFSKCQMSSIVNNESGKLYTAFQVRNRRTGEYTCWGIRRSWLELKQGKLYETLRGARQAIVTNATNRDDYEILELAILESRDEIHVHPAPSKKKKAQ